MQNYDFWRLIANVLGGESQNVKILYTIVSKYFTLWAMVHKKTACNRQWHPCTQQIN